jgi:hypothetical protein
METAFQFNSSYLSLEWIKTNRFGCSGASIILERQQVSLLGRKNALSISFFLSFNVRSDSIFALLLTATFSPFYIIVKEFWQRNCCFYVNGKLYLVIS